MPKSKAKPATLPLQDLIQEYLAELQLRNRSPQTIASYRQTLADFMRRSGPALTLGQFTRERVRAYLDERAASQQRFEGSWHPAETKPLSPYSLHRIMRNLRAFGFWLARQDPPLSNPCEHLPLPKLPKGMIAPLSPEEIKQLLDVWNPDTLFGARWQTVLSFFLDTGVRVGELADLRLENLEMNNYRAKVTGKGSKDRWVFFGNRTHRLLSKYLNTYRESACPFVFVSVDGEAMTTNGVQQIVKRAGKDSGVKRLHCHLLRHTFASAYAAQNPGDVFGLQTLLGHESLEISRQYVHLAQSMGVVGVRRTSMLDELEASGGLTFRRRRGHKAGEVGQSHQIAQPGNV